MLFRAIIIPHNVLYSTKIPTQLIMMNQINPSYRQLLLKQSKFIHPTEEHTQICLNKIRNYEIFKMYFNFLPPQQENLYPT